MSLDSAKIDQQIVQLTEKISNGQNEYFKRGKQYQEINKHELAIKDFTICIEKNPNEVFSYINRGLSYCELLKFTEAIADFSKALELSPNNDKILRYRAQALSDNKQDILALEDFNKLIEINEKNDETFNDRAKIYLGMEKSDLAIQDFTKCIELNPGKIIYLLKRALVYKDCGLYDLAINDYTKIVELNELYVLYDRAFLFTRQEKFDEAVNDYTILIENYDDIKNANPDLIDKKYIFLDRANVYLLSNRAELAVGDYSEAITLEPENSELYKLRTKSYQVLGAYQKAIDDCTQGLMYDKTSSYLYFERGSSYEHLKLYDLAYDDYSSAIKCDPNEIDSYLNRALLNLKNQRYFMAIDDYKAVITLDDKNFSAFFGLGYGYDKIGEFELALENYQNAINVNPDDYTIYKNRAHIYGKLEDYQQAIDDYNRSIKLKPDYPQLFFRRGFYYFQLANYVDASKDFQNASELFSTNGLETESKRALKCYFECHDKIDVLNKYKDLYRDYEDKLEKVLSGTNIFEDSVFNQKAITFMKFLNPYKPKDQDDKHYLEILQRWNSFTPIIAENYCSSRGGGYFLKIDGKGIVIDPGLNFIENFQESGHVFNEIDAIIISHAHNDHTADLESILILLHTYNKKLENIPVDVLEHDIEGFPVNLKKKVLDIYLTASTLKKYSGMFQLIERSNYVLHVIEQGEKRRITSNVTLDVIYANHDDIISDIYTIGIVIKFNDKIIVYSGDTGVNEKLIETYKKLKEQITSEQVIFIAHLGGFAREEKNYMFYKNHLGRLGVCLLNAILNPRICIVSEFGEELQGYRQSLVDELNKISVDTTFIAADIGLEISLNKETLVKCIDIDDKKTLFYSNLAVENVKMLLREEDYSLHYCNKQTKLEKDLKKILKQKYFEKVVCKTV